MKGRERGRHSSIHGLSWRVVAIVLAATQIIACGSVLDALPGAGKAGTKSSDLTPVQAMGTLSGVAKDGLIRNASVNVYAWNGVKGELLGSGMTDARGRYSLQLQVRSQSVLLEVVDGDYQEEVTGKNISLDTGQALYALQNYFSGKPLTTSITYYTTLATGLAEHLVRLGMKPSDAVEEANARMGNIIGVDVRTVKPIDIVNPDSVSVPELEYGFATAALSSLTERASILNDSEPHSIFTSVRFIQAAYDDVRADGLLNGRGVNGAIALGRIRLSSQVYRHELALHILRAANDKTANRTGRGPMQMFDLARRLNDSTDPVFGGDPIIPIDSDKPNVSSITAQEFPNLSNGAVVFGGLNLSAMVMTFPGAAATELLLDGRVIGTALDPENPVIVLDTLNSAIQEGPHSLKFRVTDISGAIGESPSLDVSISNRQAAIENISIAGQLLGKSDLVPLVTADIFDPARPQMIRYSVKSPGANAFTLVATINVDAGETMVQSSARVDLARAMVTNGAATFKIEVTNSVGATFSEEVPFTVDLIDPVVSIPTPITLDASDPNNLQGQYFDEQRGMPCTPVQPADPDDSCLLYVRRMFDITTQVSDNQALDSVTLTVDGKTVGQSQIASSATATATLTVDPITFLPPGRGARDGEKTVTLTVADKAQNVAMDSRQIVFDTTPPMLVSPIELIPAMGTAGGFASDDNPVALRGVFDIDAQVQDNLGFSSASLLIDGSPIATASAGQGATIPLMANGFDTSVRPDGRHVLSVIATDRAGNQLASNGAIVVDFDNTIPTLSLDTFTLSNETLECTMAGSAADDHFQSLQYSTSSGFTTELLSGAGGGAFTIGGLRGVRSFTLEAKDTLGNTKLLNGTYEYSLQTSGSGQSGPGLIIVECIVFVEGQRVFQRTFVR